MLALRAFQIIMLAHQAGIERLLADEPKTLQEIAEDERAQNKRAERPTSTLASVNILGLLFFAG